MIPAGSKLLAGGRAQRTPPEDRIAETPPPGDDASRTPASVA